MFGLIQTNNIFEKKIIPTQQYFVMLGIVNYLCSIDPYGSSDNVLFKISENQFLKYKGFTTAFMFATTCCWVWFYIIAKGNYNSAICFSIDLISLSISIASSIKSEC